MQSVTLAGKMIDYDVITFVRLSPFIANSCARHNNCDISQCYTDAFTRRVDASCSSRRVHVCPIKYVNDFNDESSVTGMAALMRLRGFTV